MARRRLPSRMPGQSIDAYVDEIVRRLNSEPDVVTDAVGERTVETTADETTLDAATATAEDVANFLGTLVNDINKGGAGQA